MFSANIEKSTYLPDQFFLGPSLGKTKSFSFTKFIKQQQFSPSEPGDVGDVGVEGVLDELGHLVFHK